MARSDKKAAGKTKSEAKSSQKPKTVDAIDGATPKKQAAKKTPKPAKEQVKTGKTEKKAAGKSAAKAAIAEAKEQVARHTGELNVSFERLIPEIAGIVSLVLQHAPSVRRAVFDSYVTAVIEFGAKASDFGEVDVIDAVQPSVVDEEDSDASVSDESGAEFEAANLRADIEAVDDEVDARGEWIAGPLRRSFTDSAREPVSGPVREASDVVREVAGPKSAFTAASRGRSGIDMSSLEAAGAAGPKRGRTGIVGAATKARQAPVALARLIEERNPRNNDQRTALIVSVLGKRGKPVTRDQIALAYEQLALRIPVNMPDSVRATVRSGLIQKVGPAAYAITDAGRAYAAGETA